MSRAEHQALWEREQRRRGTLAQLGIEPLVSRFNPEGARPHRHLEPLPQSPRSAEPPAPRTDNSRASGSAAGERRVAKPHSPEAAGTLQVAKVATESAGAQSPVLGDGAGAGQTETVEPVAFQLMIVTAGAWLWLEQLQDALIRREQLQLVQGMARAITEGDVAMSHLQFSWPLAEHAHLPQHADAAKDSVSGQLRRLARERQARGYIFMGAACREWVHVPPALACLDIPSTLDMLTEPALKRDAWQVLQPHSS